MQYCLPSAFVLSRVFRYCLPQQLSCCLIEAWQGRVSIGWIYPHFYSPPEVPEWLSAPPSSDRR